MIQIETCTPQPVHVTNRYVSEETCERFSIRADNPRKDNDKLR